MANNDHLMKTYAPLDVTFEHGEGAYLWDTNKQQYLDALCGIAVCGLGLLFVFFSRVFYNWKTNPEKHYSFNPFL